MVPEDIKLSSKFLITPVRMILEMLEEKGHAAYVVGGSVRDEVRGYSREQFLASGGDYDIATSATVTEMKQLFQRYKQIPDGEEFGTVKILVKGEVYEITTFRVDGAYRDGRRPDEVIFTDDIRADLSRRDFTINAMARDLRGRLVDPFDGVGDLARKVVRTVGDPYQRFNEDYLRMLRCVRFATVLDFAIDPQTGAAIHQIQERQPHIFSETVSPERIIKELQKMLEKNAAKGVSMLNDYLLLADTTPLNSRSEKSKLVYDHTLGSLIGEGDWLVKMALLGHATGKMSNGADYPTESAKIMEHYLRAMAVPGKDRNHIVNLIAHHDIDLSMADASVTALRWWASNVMLAYRKDDSHQQRALDDLMLVAKGHAYGDIDPSDAVSKQMYDETITKLDILRSRAVPVFQSLTDNELDIHINGHDVRGSGFEGKEIGMVLEEIKLLQPRNKDEALNWVRRLRNDPHVSDMEIVIESIGAYPDEEVAVISQRRRKKLYKEPERFS